VVPRCRRLLTAFEWEAPPAAGEGRMTENVAQDEDVRELIAQLTGAASA
jgi:hypothetical protein